MKTKVVGKIKNIKIDDRTGELEVTITILNNKFKKKLLRDLALSGNIKFIGDKVVYTGNNGE